MNQEAVSASSRYWDNKQISLTDNTKKTIQKKAYTLDAESMFAQYNLEGDQAAQALEAQGVPQEQLAENPNSYSYIALSSIDELETNASKEARVSAVLGLVKLGFTNIYESNTRNFITPPTEEETPEPEEPKAPKQEEQPAYNYTRRRPVEQQPEQPQEYYQPQPQGVSPRASLSGAARFIPNTVRQVLPMRGPNNMTPANLSPARMSPNPGAVVRPNAGLAPQRPMQTRAAAPQANRPLLNAGMAAKLGGRAINPVAQRTTIQPQPQGRSPAPRPKFGLRVKR